VPHLERLLWQGLLVSREARRAALPRLKTMEYAAPPRTAGIIAAALAAGEDFSYTSLEARLGEGDRALLASLIFADEGSEESEQDPAAQVEACLNKLEAKGLLARRAELKARIRAAEKEGDLAAAIQLSAELNAMDKQERAAVPQPSRVIE
jgi:hypothetical protein